MEALMISLVALTILAAAVSFVIRHALSVVSKKQRDLNEKNNTIAELRAIINNHETPQNQNIRKDAARYERIKYYLKNDHGSLAVNVYYGPQAILDTWELDRLLDEDMRMGN